MVKISGMKSIQPISDPDDIRKEANESTKEQYADFYVNQLAPDPLTWKPAARQDITHPEQAPQSPEVEAAELSRQNDPLKDFE
jgi:hypothetical protein